MNNQWRAILLIAACAAFALPVVSKRGQYATLRYLALGLALLTLVAAWDAAVVAW